MTATAVALPEVARAALAADPHRPGSIDRMLLERQVLLTRETAAALYQPPSPGIVPPPPGARPALATLVAEITRDSVHDFQRAVALRSWVAAIPRRFPEERSTRDGGWGDLSTFRCGGTEADVIAAGSPLAAELSRVLVTLARLAGFPARLAFLYADATPVRHTVAEVFVVGRWSVFDPVSDRCFAWPKHGYAGARELQQQPDLLDRLQDRHRLLYVNSRYYQTVALAVYDPFDPANEYPRDPLDPATAARLQAGEAS